MPNLEELIEMRNKSIEETKDLLNLIESHLKYYSYIYYNYVINPQIEADTKQYVLYDVAYSFNTNIIKEIYN
jgi:hypothetical protein